MIKFLICGLTLLSGSILMAAGESASSQCVNLPMGYSNECYFNDCYCDDAPLCCDTGSGCCNLLPVDTINGGYAFGRGIETKYNYKYLNMMMFPCYNLGDKIPFVSVSAYQMSNYKWAGSVGVGMRWQPGCRSCDIYGINAFYDLRKGNQGRYNQVGVGLEYLTKSYEWHINGYMPVGNTSNLKHIKEFDNYRGGYFVKVRKIEQAEYGLDAEVGRNLYYYNYFRFYLGAGAGWFAGSYSKEGTWAFKARAYLQLTPYITLEVRTFKETDQEWHCQGIASLSIPFECLYNFYQCGMSDLYSQPVVRNAMIKKYSECCWIKNY